MSLYKNYEIGLTEKSIEVTFDSSSTIDNWDVFKMVQIENDYITLSKKDEELNYIFPAKSMTEEKFATLEEFIRTKVK